MTVDYPSGPISAPTTAGARSYETRLESPFSGVSWGAILAGAVVAAAMGIVLLTLGAGLGLIAVSPWEGRGVSGATLGIGTIVWSIIVQIIAFGLGGYLAGRLRTKWANLHGDEIYFRDTAHGVVTWGLGTLVGMFLLASAAGNIAQKAGEVGAAASGAIGGTAMLATGAMADNQGGANGAMRGGMRGNPMDYFVDMLFRSGQASSSQASTGQASTGTAATGSSETNGATNNTGTTAAPAGDTAQQNRASVGVLPSPNADGPAARAEVSRILVTSFVNGSMSPADKSYVAQVVAARTGLSQQDAEKRIDDVVGQAKAAMDAAETKAKEAADVARTSGAALALWSLIAMLVGAFAASYAAALGGRARDL